nr:immunoglobulin light chain junction region [Macaca mulatta]
DYYCHVWDSSSDYDVF